MNDHVWAERFSQDLDNMLAGKKVDRESCSDEYGQLIDLARRLIRYDFSGECGTWQDLKKRVLIGIEKQKGKNTGEICEEDLDRVAGGLRTIRVEDD